MTSASNLEFVTALRGKTESLHVVNMFTTALRKTAPAMVVASPRVTSPQQARASGKPVIFLFGNIHPPESEAAEALQMVARDLAAGTRKDLLQNQIVIIAPIFNVDGTDTLVPQDGSLGSETPHIFGTRENAQGLDLNRDAVKLETVEANGLYRLLNAWDPALLLDGHLMSRVNHGYANTYGTTTVPAAAPGPRDYTHDKLFPAVRDMVRKEFGIEVFTHALFGRGGGAGAGRPPHGATTLPPGRSKPSSSSMTMASGTGWRSSRRRRDSRHSSAASTRSTPTSSRCSSTRTRMRRRFRPL